MSPYEKDIVRMELQIGQLISIVANMNERIIKLEDKASNKHMIMMKSVSKHRLNNNKAPELL